MRKKITVEQMARDQGVSPSTIEKNLKRLRAQNKRLDLANPPPDLSDARARLATAQAEKQETDNLIRNGTLHRNDDCDRANMEHGQQVRSELLNLGNKLAPLLANLPAREIKNELDRWANETLTAWAAWAEKRSKGNEPHRPA